MADFIIIDNARLDLVSRFQYVKNNALNDQNLVADLEQSFGTLPYYGNIKILLDERLELEGFKTRIYENFSRHNNNTMYIPEVDLMIIKLPDKTVGNRS